MDVCVSMTLFNRSLSHGVGTREGTSIENPRTPPAFRFHLTSESLGLCTIQQRRTCRSATPENQDFLHQSGKITQKEEKKHSMIELTRCNNKKITCCQIDISIRISALQKLAKRGYHGIDGDVVGDISNSRRPSPSHGVASKHMAEKSNRFEHQTGQEYRAAYLMNR